MAFNREVRINQKYVSDTNYIKVVDYSWIFKDTEHVDELFESSGLLDISTALLQGNASLSEISNAIDEILGSAAVNSITLNYENQLAFNLKLKSLTASIDIVITPEMVVTERQRRLDLGFSYDFGDERGVHHIATTDADLKSWDEVTKLSTAAILGGLPSLPINIKTDTAPVTVTAAEWQHILIAAGTFRQPIFQASFWLQEADPIPSDYATNDSYWLS